MRCAGETIGTLVAVIRQEIEPGGLRYRHGRQQSYGGGHCRRDPEQQQRRRVVARWGLSEQLAQRGPDEGQRVTGNPEGKSSGEEQAERGQQQVQTVREDGFSDHRSDALSASVRLASS